jgi:hypothetical protein
MNVLAVLLLASLPVPQVQLPDLRTAQPEPHFAQSARVPSRKGGKWYFARTGHAVYCFGPVMHMTSDDGGIERVATFCRGDQLLVPLKD